MKCKYCKEGFAIDLEIGACVACHIYTKEDEIADAMLDIKNNDFFVLGREVVKGSDEWFQLYQWGYEIPSSDIKLFKTEYAKQKGGNNGKNIYRKRFRMLDSWCIWNWQHNVKTQRNDTHLS